MLLGSELERLADRGDGRGRIHDNLLVDAGFQRSKGLDADQVRAEKEPGLEWLERRHPR